MPNNKTYIRKELPSKIETVGIALFVVGGILGAIGFFSDPIRASFAYLPAFMFLLSIAVGALFLVALEYLTGAVWSVPFRRVAEFLAALVPLLILFAIPLLLNIHSLFQWTHKELVNTDALLQGKAPYLNITFFIIRTVLIFVIWTLFYLLFIRNSFSQDKSPDNLKTRKNIVLSGIFMPIFAITLTLSGVDWLMSLEPHWFSTIFGVYVFAGTVWGSLAAVTFISIKLQENGYLPSGISKDNYYSLGTLLFAFTVFWAYIAFSQYMLIWYADLPEENFWFMHRWSGLWSIFSTVLVLAHFIVPFAALLSFNSKTDFSRLKFMSIWILAAHFLDLYWLIMPSITYAGKPWSFSWMDIIFPAAIVGLMMIVFSRFTKRVNLLPTGDPKLQRALDFRL